MQNPADVVAADDARYAAMIAGRYNELMHMLSEDLVYIHSSGRRDTRSSFLERLGRGEVRYLSVRRGDVDIKAGLDFSLLRGEIEIGFELDGVSLANSLAYVTLWRAEAGQQKLLHWQSTRLAEPL